MIGQESFEKSRNMIGQESFEIKEHIFLGFK